MTKPVTRTLTLLRHAKSSWKHQDLTDSERPLSKRGRHDAKVMASCIVGKGGSFSTVYASPAQRSRDTLMRMLQVLPAQDSRIVFDQRLYTFERDVLTDAIKQLDDSLEAVLLVGHNPALQDAIGWLTGKSVARFPTAACARMTLQLPHWSELHKGCAALDWLLTPRESWSACGKAGS